MYRNDLNARQNRCDSNLKSENWKIHLFRQTIDCEISALIAINIAENYYIQQIQPDCSDQFNIVGR